MTRAVADLKETYPDYDIDIRSPCPEIWENNSNLTPLDEKDPDVETFGIGYDEINISGMDGLHFSDAFRHDIEEKLGVKIVKSGIQPEIHISQLERTWINQVEQEYGYSGPFWIINAGYKPDNVLKKYHRWQEFASLFNDYFKGSVRLAQVGHGSHNHDELDGVFDLTGKKIEYEPGKFRIEGGTDLRQYIRLVYWAHGTVGPLSLQFVLAAAFMKPHVVVAAGKEGVRWHIYPHGRYIYTNGALKCCEYDGCWKGGDHGECVDLVNDVPRCFVLIEPYMILDAVKMYYQGGVLRMGERGL
jgi:ADP-heptose:LPS heptosyltransferase